MTPFDRYLAGQISLEQALAEEGLAAPVADAEPAVEDVAAPAVPIRRPREPLGSRAVVDPAANRRDAGIPDQYLLEGLVDALAARSARQSDPSVGEHPLARVGRGALEAAGRVFEPAARPLENIDLMVPAAVEAQIEGRHSPILPNWDSFKAFAKQGLAAAGHIPGALERYGNEALTPDISPDILAKLEALGVSPKALQPQGFLRSVGEDIEGAIYSGGTGRAPTAESIAETVGTSPGVITATGIAASPMNFLGTGPALGLAARGAAGVGGRLLNRATGGDIAKKLLGLSKAPAATEATEILSRASGTLSPEEFLSAIARRPEDFPADLPVAEANKLLLDRAAARGSLSKESAARLVELHGDTPLGDASMLVSTPFAGKMTAAEAAARDRDLLVSNRVVPQEDKVAALASGDASVRLFPSERAAKQALRELQAAEPLTPWDFAAIRKSRGVGGDAYAVFHPERLVADAAIPDVGIRTASKVPKEIVRDILKSPSLPDFLFGGVPGARSRLSIDRVAVELIDGHGKVLKRLAETPVSGADSLRVIRGVNARVERLNAKAAAKGELRPVARVVYESADEAKLLGKDADRAAQLRAALGAVSEAPIAGTEVRDLARATVAGSTSAPRLEASLARKVAAANPSLSVADAAAKIRAVVEAGAGKAPTTLWKLKSFPDEVFTSAADARSAALAMGIQDPVVQVKAPGGKWAAEVTERGSVKLSSRPENVPPPVQKIADPEAIGTAAAEEALRRARAEVALGETRKPWKEAKAERHTPEVLEPKPPKPPEWKQADTLPMEMREPEENPLFRVVPTKAGKEALEAGRGREAALAVEAAEGGETGRLARGVEEALGESLKTSEQRAAEMRGIMSQEEAREYVRAAGMPAAEKAAIADDVLEALASATVPKGERTRLADDISERLAASVEYGDARALEASVNEALAASLVPPAERAGLADDIAESLAARLTSPAERAEVAAGIETQLDLALGPGTQTGARRLAEEVETARAAADGRPPTKGGAMAPTDAAVEGIRRGDINIAQPNSPGRRFVDFVLGPTLFNNLESLARRQGRKAAGAAMNAIMEENGLATRLNSRVAAVGKILPSEADRVAAGYLMRNDFAGLESQAPRWLEKFNATHAPGSPGAKWVEGVERYIAEYKALATDIGRRTGVSTGGAIDPAQILASFSDNNRIDAWLKGELASAKAAEAAAATPRAKKAASERIASLSAQAELRKGGDLKSVWTGSESWNLNRDPGTDHILRDPSRFDANLHLLDPQDVMRAYSDASLKFKFASDMTPAFREMRRALGSSKEAQREVDRIFTDLVSGDKTVETWLAESVNAVQKKALGRVVVDAPEWKDTFFHALSAATAVMTMGNSPAGAIRNLGQVAAQMQVLGPRGFVRGLSRLASEVAAKERGAVSEMLAALEASGQYGGHWGAHIASGRDIAAMKRGIGPAKSDMRAIRKAVDAVGAAGDLAVEVALAPFSMTESAVRVAGFSAFWEHAERVLDAVRKTGRIPEELRDGIVVASKAQAERNFVGVQRQMRQMAAGKIQIPDVEVLRKKVAAGTATAEEADLLRQVKRVAREADGDIPKTVGPDEVWDWEREARDAVAGGPEAEALFKRRAASSGSNFTNFLMVSADKSPLVRKSDTLKLMTMLTDYATKEVIRRWRDTTPKAKIALGAAIMATAGPAGFWIIDEVGKLAPEIGQEMQAQYAERFPIPTLAKWAGVDFRGAVAPAPQFAELLAGGDRPLSQKFPAVDMVGKLMDLYGSTSAAARSPQWENLTPEQKREFARVSAGGPLESGREARAVVAGNAPILPYPGPASILGGWSAEQMQPGSDALGDMLMKLGDPGIRAAAALDIESLGGGLMSVPGPGLRGSRGASLTQGGKRKAIPGETTVDRGGRPGAALSTPSAFGRALLGQGFSPYASARDKLDERKERREVEDAKRISAGIAQEAGVKYLKGEEFVSMADLAEDLSILVGRSALPSDIENSIETGVAGRLTPRALRAVKSMPTAVLAGRNYAELMATVDQGIADMAHDPQSVAAIEDLRQKLDVRWHKAVIERDIERNGIASGDAMTLAIEMVVKGHDEFVKYLNDPVAADGKAERNWVTHTLTSLYGTGGEAGRAAVEAWAEEKGNKDYADLARQFLIWRGMQE